MSKEVHKDYDTKVQGARVATIGAWGSFSGMARNTYFDELHPKPKQVTEQPKEPSKIDTSVLALENNAVVPAVNFAPTGRSQRPW